MPNPFVEDEEIREETEQEGAIETQQPEIKELEDESVEVAFDVPEEEVEQQKLSRDEKKRNRYREEQEGRIRAEAELDAMRRENERLRAQPAPQPYASQHQPEDPIQKELDDVYERQTALQEAFAARTQANNLTPEEHTKMLSQARKLDEKKQDLIATRAVQRANSGQQNPNASTQQMIQARYFDVVQNPNAYRWSLGRLQQRLAEGADNRDMSVMDDVAEEARKKFRIGRYRNGAPPSDATRARHTGVPTGMTTPPKAPPRGIKMDKSMKRIALAMYPTLSPEQAYKEWANSVGKKMVAGDRHDR
jgi:hypothetical protein